MKWLFLTMFLSLPLTAYELLRWRVEPQDIRLATPVELIIELALNSEEEPELLQPWPESDEFLVSDLKTELSTTTEVSKLLKLSITVTFYRLGKVVLQGVHFANFELEPLEFVVNSFISEQRVEFQFEEEPQLLPGTIAMLTVVTITVVLIPLLLLLFWYFVFPKLRVLWLRKWHSFYAYARFCYTLLKLEKNSLKQQPTCTYTLMNRALRSYLSSLFKSPCQSYTSIEICRLLTPYLKEVEALFVILKNSDEVRFSSIPCTTVRCTSDLKNLKKLVILIHKGVQKIKNDKL